jgi:hypothetical protein
MESSILCKDANHEHLEKYSNHSLSNPTKASTFMEELERKNNGRCQPMTPISIYKWFPSLRGRIDWWSCGSTPLLVP